MEGLPLIIFAAILIAVAVLLGRMTFGSGAALIVASCVLAAALIGGAIAEAEGGDFLDGFMMGAMVAAAAASLALGATTWFGLSKKRKRSQDKDDGNNN